MSDSGFSGIYLLTFIVATSLNIYSGDISEYLSELNSLKPCVASFTYMAVDIHTVCISMYMAMWSFCLVSYDEVIWFMFCDQSEKC